MLKNILQHLQQQMHESSPYASTPEYNFVKQNSIPAYYYIVRPGLDGDCEIVCTEFVKCVNEL